MKVFLTVLLLVCVAAVLIFGNRHWNEQISKHHHPADVNTVKVEDHNKASTTASLLFTKNWPKESVAEFEKKLKADEPYQILLVGAKSKTEKDWTEAVISAMKETYGETIRIDVLDYDLTSTAFVQQEKQKDLIEAKADMILLEPFTLNDNGEVITENSLANITTILTEVRASKPTTTVILQPPYPLFNAKFYPRQVEALQKYAEEEKLPYLNHWQAWPDDQSEDLKQYLIEDLSAPNEAGYDLWSSYLVDYFIAKP